MDCAGQELGKAYVDSCGQCVGGLTGATPCEATEDGGAGSSDAGSGSGEEVDVTDGGTPDSDPSGDQDAGGASTGETDAGSPDDPMLPDAGSEPATDAGAEWGAMDGGSFEGLICDDYECDPGFECVVEWLDCAVERFDAGSSDGGSQCIDYEVVCIEVGDAGSTVPTAVDSGPGLPEVIDAGVAEARDGGHTATGSPEDGGGTPPWAASACPRARKIPRHLHQMAVIAKRAGPNRSGLCGCSSFSSAVTESKDGNAKLKDT